MQMAAACELNMDKNVAKEVVSAAMKASRELHTIVPFIKQSLDEEEYERLARRVAAASAGILEEIINPILAEHPELAPLGMRVPKL